MIKKIKNRYAGMTFTSQIRVSYIFIIMPIIVFFLFVIINMIRSNAKLEEITTSVTKASEFSLDFQKDFDFETYLVIVGNKTLEESDLDELLAEATEVVDELMLITDSGSNIKTLKSISKYLSNLNTYKNRIGENLEKGNLYEDNIEIWENDVQIVTSLIRESMIAYIHNETVELQKTKEEYQTSFVRLIQGTIIVSIILSLFFVAFSYYIPIGITKSLRELSEMSNHIAEGDFDVKVEAQGSGELIALANSMNRMAIQINELVEQVKVEQVRLRKSEFELLQAQINPHFLYNTLDAIMWLAQTGESEQAVDMVRSLSDFFRTSLNQGKDIISIKEELRHAESYLEIQQVRYQDILKYNIEVSEEILNCRIPKITIQPLVENALYHGIKNRRGMGIIRIEGEKVGNEIRIAVKDNGIGIEEERLIQVKNAIRNGIPGENDIYGLYNVNERIRLNFGEEYGISIESRYGEGTSVVIKLPA